MRWAHVSNPSVYEEAGEAEEMHKELRLGWRDGAVVKTPQSGDGPVVPAEESQHLLH